MGQSNPSQIHQKDSSSSCCLSRRYIIHANIQKQNQLKQKNQKSASLYNHQLNVYSKQRIPQNLNAKPPQNAFLYPITQLNLGQRNFNSEKYINQQIGNLGLESHLVQQKDNGKKEIDLSKEKQQILKLRDISEENQRNSTRQNSLSSRNFSNKNSVSANNYTLRNKIKNIKLKYASPQQIQTENIFPVKPLPLSYTKETKFIKEFKNTKLTTNNLISEDANPARNFIPQQKKDEESEQIQFFSEDSDSDNASSLNSENETPNKHVNEQMLNSQKIDIMVHQFNIKKKTDEMIRKANLEKIPEESQRIQSSKSQDQVAYSIPKKSPPYSFPQKMCQKIDSQKNKVQNSQTSENKIENRLPKVLKDNKIQKMKANELQKNVELSIKQISKAHKENEKEIKKKHQKIVGHQQDEKIITTNKVPKSKKIIAF